MDAIVASFQAMEDNKPLSDPYGLQFSTVALGPLSKFDQRKRYSLGVNVGPEKESFNFPFIMSFLTVNVEFRVTVNRDDDAPGRMGEELLTVVKRRLLEDRSWGGLAIDTKVVGSELDLMTYSDRAVVGVCVIEVQFRYSHLDPRNANPDP